jgi:hypothetical protein
MAIRRRIADPDRSILRGTPERPARFCAFGLLAGDTALPFTRMTATFLNHATIRHDEISPADFAIYRSRPAPERTMCAAWLTTRRSGRPKLLPR